jgi:biotin operon repressor
MSNVLMNRTRSRIIRFLLKNGPSTSGQIGAELHASRSSIRHHLNALRDAGLVRHTSTHFSTTPEQVQLQIEALAACFHCTVMPPDPTDPMIESTTQVVSAPSNEERIEGRHET